MTLLFLVIPLAAYAATTDDIKAEIASLLARIEALTQHLEMSQGGTQTRDQEICSILSGRFLSRGTSGADVSTLQRFLKQQSFFYANATGYFGPLTESALIEFQLGQQIISSASEGGVFGPRTREYVSVKWCSSGGDVTPQPTPLPPALACPNPPQPTLTCDGRWEKFYNQNQCHVGWTCIVTQAKAPEVNKAPLISAIVGPTVLKLNEDGSWKITASDPENNALVHSVVWGDEGANIATLLNIAQEGTPYSAATTITHAYKNTGAYTIVVFAKDTAGNIVKSTLSIVVYEPAPVVPTPPPPPPKTNSSCLLLGQTFPHGTILPFYPFNWHPLSAGTQAVTASAMQLCAMGCGGGYRVRYQCQNGDWVKIDTGYPYWPYPVALKPVIYLYPTTTEEVVVKLRYKGQLAYTYPPYDVSLGGWKVIARPDGTLTNLADRREYSYLFWEGKDYSLHIDENIGFVVRGSDTREFLQTKLAELGLTPREYNEFIVFWLPRMQDNPYNFVQFVGSEYTDIAPLSVSPKPDSVLRVFMAFRPLDNYKTVTEQKLHPFERKGFSVIEWGGTELAK